MGASPGRYTLVILVRAIVTLPTVPEWLRVPFVIFTCLLLRYATSLVLRSMEVPVRDSG